MRTCAQRATFDHIHLTNVMRSIVCTCFFSTQCVRSCAPVCSQRIVFDHAHLFLLNVLCSIMRTCLFSTYCVRSCAQVKSSGELYFVELDYPTCICNVAADQGTIGGYSWGNQRCVGKPLGQMLDDPAWLVGPHANIVDGGCVFPTWLSLEGRPASGGADRTHRGVKKVDSCATDGSSLMRVKGSAPAVSQGALLLQAPLPLIALSLDH
jgi:hypothetical protein